MYFQMNCVMSARPLVARSTRTGVQCFSSALFGGRDEQSFRQICEGSSKFVKDVLSPKIVSLSPGSLTMVLPFKQDFIGNPLIPCLHGGIAASMLDHAASSCATAALEDTKLYVVTSDLRIDYLLPAPCEDLFFDATIVHRSKKLVRVDASCWNNDRTRQVAIGRGLFSVCERSAEEEVPKPVAE